MIQIINYKNKNNKKHLLVFQDKIFLDFNDLLEKLCESNDIDYKRSALISYWLNDYKNYLINENQFSPKKLVKYKRGTIIKANLGFNLGNEQGGLHYCVVLNKNDSINQTLLNVVPLTSIKDKDKKIYYTNLSLGNEIYESLHLKLEEKSKIYDCYTHNIDSMLSIVEDLVLILMNINSDDQNEEHNNYLDNKPAIDKYINSFNNLLNSDSWNDDYVNSIFTNITDLPVDSIDNASKVLKIILNYISMFRDLLEIINKQQKNNEKIKKEINKMKNGSIALVNQITTISKMRIYSPKTTDDALYNIKLSNDLLTQIDNKIKELFTY